MEITKAHLKEFGEIYKTFYENDYDSCLVSMGDEIINKYPEITKAFVQARKDFLSSDREVAAYAVWFFKYHKSIEKNAQQNKYARKIL